MNDDRDPATAAVDLTTEVRRAEAVALLLAGKSRRDVAATLHVSRNTVRAWAESPDVAMLLRANAGLRASTSSEPASTVAGSAGSAGSGSPATEPLRASSDALEVVRGVMSDPQASPSTKLAAARAVLEEQDRRDGRRRAIRWAEIDVEADTEGTDSEVLRGLALRLWQVVDERERQTAEQREGCARSVFGGDLTSKQAQAFVDALDARSLAPSRVERLLTCSLREAADIVQAEIDAVARDCAEAVRPVDLAAVEPVGDA